jgi:hypothetical protein
MKNTMSIRFSNNYSREVHGTLVSDFMGGPALGGGFEYRLDFRRSLFLDFRYNRLYGVSTPKTMVFSEFLVTTGIPF